MNIINSIIRFSLKNRLFVLVGAVLLIAGGVGSMRNMDVDVFPDLTAPTVVIMTDAHGMATEEVERLVTFPIETAVNGATNVRRVRSASMYGYSFVWTTIQGKQIARLHSWLWGKACQRFPLVQVQV